MLRRLSESTHTTQNTQVKYVLIQVGVVSSHMACVCRAIGQIGRGRVEMGGEKRSLGFGAGKIGENFGEYI